MKRQMLIVGLIVLLLAGGLSGCGGDASDGQDVGTSTQGDGSVVYEDLTIEDLGFTVDDYPRVDGSTSAHPLAVLVACKILDVPYEWSTWHVGEATRLYPKDEAGKEYIADYIWDNIVHNGTHGSYVNLIDRTADLIIVARLPSDDELDLAEDWNTELVTEPVALDAFCFILNASNPVANLTIEQIQGIYTGEITEWTEVTSAYSIRPYDGAISPYRRNANSGSQELMETLVMKDLEMMEFPEWIRILGGMMAPFESLSADKYGICYTVYFYAEFMAPKGTTKLIAVNGVFPDYESISSRTYPLTTEVYVAIRTDLDPESNAYKLRDWLLGEDGQEVVYESGYVPVLPVQRWPGSRGSFFDK